VTTLQTISEELDGVKPVPKPKKNRAVKPRIQGTCSKDTVTEGRLLPFDKHPLSESVWTTDLETLPQTFQKAYNSHLAAKRVAKY
jgi:hypothetical protein